MLTAEDVTGLLALPPTPFLEGADPLGFESTVDLAEAVRVVEAFIADGVGGIGLCGTTGECATLTWGERCELYDATVSTVAGRVPVYAGATALGTKETVGQLRTIRSLGAQGALVGLPLWQTPTVANAVRFYADLSEAVPDLAIVVYANRFFFKFDYPIGFWEGLVEAAPTAIACKVTFDLTEEIQEVAGDTINFLHGEGGALGRAWRSNPASVTAGWATSAAMGPEPWVAFFDALGRGDDVACEAALNAIDSVPLPIPDFSQFAQFNIQLEKARISAAGYMRCGPPRPPYTDLPEEWMRAAEINANCWRELRSRFARSGGAK